MFLLLPAIKNKTIIQNKQKTGHFLGIQNFEDAYLAGSYIVILTDAKSFSPDTVLQLLYTSVKPSC